MATVGIVVSVSKYLWRRQWSAIKRLIAIKTAKQFTNFFTFFTFTVHFERRCEVYVRCGGDVVIGGERHKPINRHKNRPKALPKSEIPKNNKANDSENAANSEDSDSFFAKFQNLLPQMLLLLLLLLQHVLSVAICV